MSIHNSNKDRNKNPEIYPRFPLFIDLQEKKVVLIGGGTVGSRRIAPLLSFGAEITLISPDWVDSDGFSHPEITQIHWLQREYRQGDLNGAVLAITATNNRAVNHAVFQEAKERGIPISVADCPEESTFYFPAICKSETLICGVVSVDGSAHKEVAKGAVAIRKVLDELEELT